MRALRCSLLLLFGVIGIAGCHVDPNARQGVSGTVLFKGLPLDQGEIRFVSANNGPSQAGATIQEGKYTVPRDLGLVPGTYKVSVLSYDQKGAKVASNDMPGDVVGKQYKERISAKYNVQTTLTAEVTATGPNVFEFKVD